MQVNLKLILIIIFAAIIGGIIGFSIREITVREDLIREFPREKTLEFIVEHYDQEEHEFKMTETSPPDLEATFYALETASILELDLETVISPSEVFDKIRSYYSSPGYYLEKDKDPVFSTDMALVIDTLYPEDLDQDIDLTWLKQNSLENENLESEKFNPQYQRAVLRIYKNITSPQTIREISSLHLEHYCDFSSDEISDEDYLKTKCVHIAFISDLTRVSTMDKSCLKSNDINTDQERLRQTQIDDNDIKEIFWLYYLKKFYRLSPDSQALSKILRFYSDGGFKESLNDKKANLIGTYYGVLFIKEFSSDFREETQ